MIRATKDHINTRILQSMIHVIPLIICMKQYEAKQKQKKEEGGIRADTTLDATMRGQESKTKKKPSKKDPEEGTPVHISWPAACLQACLEGQLRLVAHVFVSSVRLGLILLAAA